MSEFDLGGLSGAATIAFHNQVDYGPLQPLNQGEAMHVDVKELDPQSLSGFAIATRPILAPIASRRI